jgi:hypothetical protein
LGGHESEREAGVVESTEGFGLSKPTPINRPVGPLDEYSYYPRWAEVGLAEVQFVDIYRADTRHLNSANTSERVGNQADAQIQEPVVTDLGEE